MQLATIATGISRGLHSVFTFVQTQRHVFEIIPVKLMFLESCRRLVLLVLINLVLAGVCVSQISIVEVVVE